MSDTPEDRANAYNAGAKYAREMRVGDQYRAAKQAAEHAGYTASHEALARLFRLGYLDSMPVSISTDINNRIRWLKR